MNTIAIILAAGKASRLKPLTNNLPKCLLKIGPESIIERQIRILTQNNIEKIIIVVGFISDLVKKHCQKNFPKIQFEFIENKNFKKTNTLYSLFLASKKIKDQNSVLLLNGDVVFDSEIIKNILKSSKSLCAVKIKKVNEEDVKVLSYGTEVKKINKLVPKKEAIGEAIGINLFTPSFWSSLTKNLNKDYSTEYFEYAIEKTLSKENVLNIFNIGKFRAIEVDFIDDLNKARKISWH